MKKCSGCKKNKHLKDYYLRIGVPRSRCKSCMNLASKARKKTKTGKRNARKYQIKTKYGITLEQLESKLDKQKGKCAICFNDLIKPCIDHDHLTGKIRGILCSNCNSAIGFLQDEPFIAESAAYYLHLSKEK